MESVVKYFPDLTSVQIEKIASMKEVYAFWNKRINLVSRKDFHHLYTRHVLHSLAIAKIVGISQNTDVVDVGTGGGFPGVPLAIYYPDSRFHLVDSTGKKISALSSIVRELKLDNVSTQNSRIEELGKKFDIITARAVATLDTFYRWTKQLFKKDRNQQTATSILYLRGGDVFEDLKRIPLNHRIYNISDYFSEDFFESKKLVHLY